MAGSFPPSSLMGNAQAERKQRKVKQHSRTGAAKEKHYFLKSLQNQGISRVLLMGSLIYTAVVHCALGLQPQLLLNVAGERAMPEVQKGMEN